MHRRPRLTLPNVPLHLIRAATTGKPASLPTD